MPDRPSAATVDNNGLPASTHRPKSPHIAGTDALDTGGTNPFDILTIHWKPAEGRSRLTDGNPFTDKAGGKKPPSAFHLTSINAATKRSAPSATTTTTTTTTTTATTTSTDLPSHTLSTSAVMGRRRQSSIPSARIPMGPRPLDVSGSKRSVSNSVVPQYNALNGASAVASRDPYTHQLSINDISRFSFASIAPKASPQEEQDDQLELPDFLEPTFNFDDFHDNIVGTEPSLNHFPLPGGGGSIQVPVTTAAAPVEQKKTFIQPAIPIPTRKGSGTTTALTRKGSTASSNASRASAKSESVSTVTTSILRGRRQSQFPPNSFNNPGPKAPRKSIGPGTFVAPDPVENGPKRWPSVGGRKSSVDSPKVGPSTGVGKPSSHGDETGVDGPKLPRRMRSKSSRGSLAPGSLAPKRPSSKDLLTPSRTPDPGRSTSTNAHHTPNRRSGTPGRTTTPGATATGNRRMSVMPHHATGLGARTVSPTDARRMKRMSMVPPAPPLPQSRISQAPPTPLPEPVRPITASTAAHSPAPASRKSLTPSSSSRTTPDPNRKSYSSGQSLSSNTSYNSVRNTAVLTSRVPQPTNSSRLPTPKPRLDISTTVNLELEVPPVPAIPKAYESPGSDIDQPFFSARSSSLPPIDGPIAASPVVSSVADAMSTLDTPRPPSSSSHASAGLQAEAAEHMPKQLQLKVSKKNLQSLRLPPLNLLPLSTPTNGRIKSWKDSKHEAGEKLTTPPPLIRGNMKTPSTPMTASKASFFSRSYKATEEVLGLRSSTSHYALRSDEQRPPSDASPILPAFGFETEQTSQRNISPWVSSSLPKSGDDFASFMRPDWTTELNRSQARPNGPRAPSFSVTPKTEPTQSPVEKPVETESVFSTTTLRRKLSRKRNEPKLPDFTNQDVNLSKYNNMPPPKLPASATWTNPLTKSSSPLHKPTYLKSRRQTSGSSTNTGLERQDSFDSAVTHVSASRPSLDSGRSLTLHSNRSGSLSTISLPNPANGKPTPPRSQEAGLDREDMIAEEEMKRLALKRKDFESAARELDALRARASPARRVSAATASRAYDLNIFERGEIVDYADVYFTGTPSARKIVGDMSSASTNFGYDDDRGDYKIVEGDHLAYRYEVVDLLGKGSFGQVVRCVDHKTGILVAVKIIRNKKRFHQQALVEVNILQKLKEWDPAKKHSVVNFDQSFYFRGHLCISTDLLDMNLYEFIKAHDFRGFSLKLIRRFTKQLLNSLVLLHNHKVIHCDLKPENILLAHPVHSEIKVIDFGSSCFEHEKVYTYIQSRFYRSPEVILGMSYGMPIDMWSVGCILAELYTGYPIFPGENEQEQLACIMEVFGPPEKHLIEKSSRRKLFFDSMGKPRLTVSSKGRRRRPSSKDLRQVLKCDDEAFLDFITRCLRWDPTRRMTPHEANKHEFITGVKTSSSHARRNLSNLSTSPIKRINSVTAPGGVRPLPQPPTTSLKVSVATRQDSLAHSPSKPATRRQSTMPVFQTGTAQAKRASHAAMTSASNPGLSRITMSQRNLGGRSDLATAAAAASLVK